MGSLLFLDPFPLLIRTPCLQGSDCQDLLLLSWEAASSVSGAHKLCLSLEVRALVMEIRSHELSALQTVQFLSPAAEIGSAESRGCWLEC